MGRDVRDRPAVRGCVAAAALLTIQITLIRPRLSRPASQILAGADLSRSRTHLYYVAAEAAKVMVLAALGSSLLAR